jgi:hypothetical protein
VVGVTRRCVAATLAAWLGRSPLAQLLIAAMVRAKGSAGAVRVVRQVFAMAEGDGPGSSPGHGPVLSRRVAVAKGARTMSGSLVAALLEAGLQRPTVPGERQLRV